MAFSSGSGLNAQSKCSKTQKRKAKLYGESTFFFKSSCNLTLHARKNIAVFDFFYRYHRHYDIVLERLFDEVIVLWNSCFARAFSVEARVRMKMAFSSWIVFVWNL